MVLCDLIVSVFSVKAKSRDEYLKEKFAEYAEYFEKTDEDKTGKERLLTCLRDMWLLNSWEGSVVQNTLVGTFLFGLCTGSVVRARDRIHNFQKKFDHMQFEGQYQASRKLADVMMLSSLKSGVSLGVKFCLIPTFCSAAVCCSLAYRNYVNPLDFAATVGTAGALYSIPSGPQAMASAAIIGSALGLIGGCIIWSSFKLSGTTVVEFRHWSTAKHKRAMAQMSQKSWDQWSKSMEEFRSMHQHDQIHGVRIEPRSIDKSFDSIPDAKSEPATPSKSL